jgi:hypothetical protein
LKFFTNPYGDWPYHLIPYHIWRRGYTHFFQILIIDPGVQSLKGKTEYKYIDEYPLKTSGNIYWVNPDYPSDAEPNLTPKECVEKSWENIEKWSLLPNVISSVQYEFENFKSFKQNYNKLYPIAERIGIGNLCRSKNLKFLKGVINYILSHNPDRKWIHFFGLYKYAIIYLNSFKVPFEVSVDSMKWDYGMHRPERKAGTYGNTKAGRWEDFHKYYKDLLPAVRQTRLGDYNRD